MNKLVIKGAKFEKNEKTKKQKVPDQTATTSRWSASYKSYKEIRGNNINTLVVSNDVPALL